ncbi:MAG TPA: hypothetical protein VMC42_03235 [Methanoregulaceae archaeon]|nr:hypothetical protein [Methanoregulaceae archaeon]
MAGTSGAYELKVSGNSQSVPLDSGFSQPGLKIANPGTPEPTVTPPAGPTTAPTTVPTTVPTAASTPVPTKNISYYQDISKNSTVSQEGMLDKLSDMLNRSGMMNPFMFKETTPVLGSQDMANKSPVVNQTPFQNQTGNSTPLNVPVDTITNNLTPVLNNTTPSPTPVPVQTGPSPSVSGRDVSGNGTICLIAMDNGFYGIVADDGQQFLPGKIDQGFLVDGLRVSFRGISRPDKQGEHTWGTPLDLIEIARLGSVTETRISSKGTIRYIDRSNGSFGIFADNRLKYIPVFLGPQFRTDGLRVNFSAYPANITNSPAGMIPVRIVTIMSTGEPLDPTIVLTGNVTWVNLGGGFYGIMGDDGNLYIPSNLDKKFMKTEFQVNFTAEKTDDSLSRSRLWGIPVELLGIENCS